MKLPLLPDKLPLPPAGTPEGDSMRWFEDVFRRMDIPEGETVLNAPFALRGRSNQTYGPGDTVATMPALKKRVEKSMNGAVKMYMSMRLVGQYGKGMLDKETEISVHKDWKGIKDLGFKELKMGFHSPCYTAVKDTGSLIEVKIVMAAAATAYIGCMCNKTCTDKPGKPFAEFIKEAVASVNGAVPQDSPGGGTEVTVKFTQTTNKCIGECQENAVAGLGVASRTAYNDEGTFMKVYTVPGHYWCPDESLGPDAHSWSIELQTLLNKRKGDKRFYDERMLFTAAIFKDIMDDDDGLEGGIGDWLDGNGPQAGCC